MKALPLALGGILIVTGAFAQATMPPPPPPPGGATTQDAGPPPPGERGPRGPGGPGGPGSERRPPPPPPRGAAIHIERSAEGASNLDVRCAEADTTKDCADITLQLLDKLGAPAPKR